MKIACLIGEIELTGELGRWRPAAARETVEPGLELIRLDLECPEPETPPRLTVEWRMPLVDMHFLWQPNGAFVRKIPADWCAPLNSDLATSAPVLLLGSQSGENRLLFAVSEAMRPVRFKAGVHEESCEVICSVELFSRPEAPISSYHAELRLDFRPLFYADAIRDAFAWFAAFPEYVAAAVPPAAYEPFYSSWYSYHQELFAPELERECALAAQYGMKGLIVDDGWQTDDNRRGYAYCGDWEISKRRFPDMRAHVERIHRLGMKYLVWFSVPFVGDRSRNRERFRDKVLYRIPALETAVLDPRFPEVREFLISTYVKTLREWDIDGFKLDFIDSFRFEGEDPAIRENYAGRDFKSLPEAVNRLLSESRSRLERIRPGILIEFRQSYIGPAVRKYGNLFRAGDCPGDILSNRLSTIDLRLSSGNTAVHSDMLEWSARDTAENAALQLLNVIFSVPQISVRLAAIPEEHRNMLKFWLGFMRVHREVLLFGKLTPYHPELNYPLVVAETDAETVIAVYGAGTEVRVPGRPGTCCWIVNGSGADQLLLDLPLPAREAVRFDATGRRISGAPLAAGLSRIPFSKSGLLELRF